MEGWDFGEVRTASGYTLGGVLWWEWGVVWHVV